MALRENSYRSSRICHILGNPVTFKILEALLDKPRHTPSELAKKTHRSISTISGHLREMRLADLVRYEARGNQVMYRVKYRREARAITETLKKYVALSGRSTPTQQ